MSAIAVWACAFLKLSSTDGFQQEAAEESAYRSKALMLPAVTSPEVSS